MSRSRRRRDHAGSVPAVAGGCVSRERLLREAASAGRDGESLVRRLARRALPSDVELARVFGMRGGLLRVEGEELQADRATSRLLDPIALRQHRCVPCVILDRVCVLAVAPGFEDDAVDYVRGVLRRDVVPVTADGDAIRAVLEALASPAPGVPGSPRRPASRPLEERFDDIAIAAVLRDAIPAHSAEGQP